MIDLSFQVAAEATAGQLIGGQPQRRFCGLSIDSRHVIRGGVFVAIAGDRFDGHDYALAAAEAGAALLVLQRPLDSHHPVARLQVDDTRKALGALCAAWLREVAPTVVAITGSMGKTTTKELVAAILASDGATHYNPGNFNNDIGVPLTLATMPRSTRYLVSELGMSAPGEIETLSRMISPDVAVITNVAPVHLEGLGSLEAVAKAKAEIAVGLKVSGTLVAADDPLLLAQLRLRPTQRLVRFGSGPTSDYRLRASSTAADGQLCVAFSRGEEEVRFRMALDGKHNAKNGLAAIAAAEALEISWEKIHDNLAKPLSLPHRQKKSRIGRWHILDDCYNSNPEAMKAALDTVVDLAAGKPVIAVVGEMRELGLDAEDYHRDVGAYAASLPLNALITVGRFAEATLFAARAAGMDPENCIALEKAEDVAPAVCRCSPDDSWILFKASRGLRLERAIEALREMV